MPRFARPSSPLALACRLVLLFSGFLCLIVTPLTAADLRPRFNQLTVADGLPEASAIDLIQDRIGFIWIATLNGLVRFDGHEYLVFKPDPQDLNSLADRELISLAEDDKGRIWIGTGDRGVDCFDPATQTFSHYPPDDHRPGGLSGATAWALLVDRQGMIWVGTERGLNRIEPASGQVMVYRHDTEDPQSLPHDEVRALYEDRVGRLWVGTRGGLALMDRSSGRFKRYQHRADQPHSLSNNDVACLFEDRHGTLWIGSGALFDRAAGGGLNRYRPDSDDFAHYRHDPADPYSLGYDNVLAIAEDRQGHLWIGTSGTDFDGGLNLFDRETGRFQRFSYDPDDPQSISSNRITSLITDAGGMLWIGTWLGGVNTMNPAQSAFRRFRYQSDSPNGLKARSINTLYEDENGILWLGGWGSGLHRYDPDQDWFSAVRADANHPTGLTDHDITAIIGDGNGGVWVGTWATGLHHVDSTGKLFTDFRHDPANPGSLSHNRVTALLRAKNGELWVGTPQGLNQLTSQATSFRRFLANPDDPHGLSHPHITALVEDDRGRIWIATGDDRLQRLQPDQNRLVHYENLGIERIRTLTVDSRGRLWVGAHANGLHRIDPDSGRVVARYDERHGLPIDSVRGILEDDHGFLWVSTARGLARFDPDNETFRAYSDADGLPAALAEINADARGPSGTLYFSGIDGFVAFRPVVGADPPPPPVALTSVEILGPQPRQLTDFKAPNVLGPAQNHLRFTFAALRFDQADRYRYRDRHPARADAHRPVPRRIPL